ncbi:uncharacterized protein TRIADDRAFT_21429 [Trichoplax adhaerens]|uniref:Methyltransferase-like protein 22 n=1 Tax=Trichoplax adhaerens TaxID=10228 RepID=B3RMS2_TRIAD|nr:hypothetical protein TRIADDRAFT_21429 [Trichoplax adhaerens]EDV27326.1 hypothetical protein TRIADDRAFT_21429 [Trichoplax adhaerens]|eukprot:XP_002109160.1 hypothetical protein TRIADDRAFT_21429 [Trichoplax adhaerens]
MQLQRRKINKESFARSVLIRHCMATPLQQVGLQVWRGALLMCDFILHHVQLFRECYCLELGAGVGLASLIVAPYAKRVYATDIGDDILKNCYLNLNYNEHLLTNRSIYDIIRVRELNWLDGIPKLDSNSAASTINGQFSWLKDDLLELYDCVDTIIACDVIYDDNQTSALLTLIKDILTLRNPKNSRKTVYVAMEKRINFTLIDLEETAPAYNHFLSSLDELIVKNDCKLTAQRIDISFPQYFQYERVKQLELWKLTAGLE